MPFIHRFAASNYKSIASADIHASRVNVFIGEPNSGKSNLLEALALLSSGIALHLPQITRAREAADLFFDHDITSPIEIVTNGDSGWSLAFNAQTGNFDYKIVDPVKKQISNGSIPPNLGISKHPQVPSTAHWPQNQESNLRYYGYLSSLQRQQGHPPPIRISTATVR